MSKLLESIKAWGSSLLNANKAFIAEQSLPSGELVEQYFDTDGSTTAPYDGWVRIGARCDYLEASTNNCFFVIGNQAQNWPSSTLPVKKGATVIFNCYNLAPDEKIFVHFIQNSASSS